MTPTRQFLVFAFSGLFGIQHMLSVSGWMLSPIIPRHCHNRHHSIIKSRRSLIRCTMVSSDSEEDESATELSVGGSSANKRLDNSHKDDDTPRESSHKREPSRDSNKIQQRTQIRYCSVSPEGFWAFLDVASPTCQLLLPVAVTSDARDYRAATTAHALTLVQLLSGVDMAGAVLPPELLAQLTVAYCNSCTTSQDRVTETTASSSSLQQLRLAQSIAQEQKIQKDKKLWPRTLPTVTLDQLTIHVSKGGSNNNETEQPSLSFALQVAVGDKQSKKDDNDNTGTAGTLTIVPTVDSMLDVIWHEQNNDETLLAFGCLALALRYKAPTVLSLVDSGGGTKPETLSTFSTSLLMDTITTNDSISDEEVTGSSNLAFESLEDRFPWATPVTKLQQASSRVANNIERSFRVNQLQAALRLAQQQEDEAAVIKIRAALDELDSLDGLPVQPDSDTESMQ